MLSREDKLKMIKIAILPDELFAKGKNFTDLYQKMILDTSVFPDLKGETRNKAVFDTVKAVIKDGRAVKEMGFGKRALLTAAAPALLLGGIGAIHGIERWYSKAAYKTALNKMYEKNKELKEYPKVDVETAFSSLYQLHPELARNAAVSGQWVITAMNSGVSAPPIDLASKLMKEREGKPRVSQQLLRSLLTSTGTNAVSDIKDVFGLGSHS